MRSNRRKRATSSLETTMATKTPTVGDCANYCKEISQMFSFSTCEISQQTDSTILGGCRDTETICSCERSDGHNGNCSPIFKNNTQLYRFKSTHNGNNFLI